MTIGEFIDMLKAIEEEKPFKVGFQLQWSGEGDLTLQGLTSSIHPTTLRIFMQKVEQAQPPIYDDHLGNEREK